MKKSTCKYLLGLLFLTLFLARDIMPGISRLAIQDDLLTSLELVGQPESEKSGKSNEPVRESESNEYWMDAIAGSLLFSGYFYGTSVQGRPDTYYLQQVYLSIPTPPPDNIS